MKTTTQILPGVNFIGWLDSRHLTANVALAGICRMPIPILTTITPIDFFDEPQCECKTKKDSGGYEDTASLKFLCGEKLPDRLPLAFVVTDNNGRSFLIGSKEHPLAIVQPDERLGKPDGDNVGIFYEITHVAIKSLVPCIISI